MYSHGYRRIAASYDNLHRPFGVLEASPPSDLPVSRNGENPTTDDAVTRRIPRRASIPSPVSDSQSDLLRPKKLLKRK
ncbi:hypothetical protein OPV22_023366 [Ensete ventricosum]|uniref:Uncharacterized protein n=1 Tax=Ensete ventricosum TaxID=4639 RepID=A0AAV8QRV7_ENSVE|nr:hypothetical protein OPV22_023366 [Ensete ventricosum]